METTPTKIPTWLIVVTFLFAMMEITVSFSIFSSPKEVIESLDTTASGVGFLAKMWAVRQFALGVILAVAAFKKSSPMLVLAYFFLLVMFLGDLLIAVLEKQNMLMISALAMSSIAAVLLYFSNRYKAG